MQYFKGSVVAAATLVGVAGVLVLNPTGGETATATAAGTTAATDAGGAGSTPEATEATPAAEETPEAAVTTEATPSAEESTATAEAAPAESAAASATYTGEVYTTPWGPIQLEATIEGGVIVDITFISLPGDHKSAAINDRAAPLLVEEALAAQSASVDSISGATWTSEGFRYSLQSALTQAGL